MSIHNIITGVIEKEGSAYTNDPSDSGGPTKYGITLKTLEGYRGRKCTPQDVKDLSELEARAIYYQMFVKDPGFEQVNFLSAAIAEELVDSGVNCGVGRPTIWLQEELNNLNNGGTHYADIEEDGRIGPGTMKALKAFLERRGKEGEMVLVRALNVAQGQHYRTLVRRRAKDEKYYYGWLLNRVA